jgi:hypothetical protein
MIVEVAFLAVFTNLKLIRNEPAGIFVEQRVQSQRQND